MLKFVIIVISFYYLVFFIVLSVIVLVVYINCLLFVLFHIWIIFHDIRYFYFSICKFLLSNLKGLLCRDLASGCVLSRELASGCVLSRELASGCVLSRDLASGCVRCGINCKYKMKKKIIISCS